MAQLSRGLKSKTGGEEGPKQIITQSKVIKCPMCYEAKVWGSVSKFNWGTQFELEKSNKATWSNWHLSWDGRLGKNSPGAEIGKKAPQPMASRDCRWEGSVGEELRRAHGAPVQRGGRSGARRHRSHHVGTRKPGQGFGVYPKCNCLLLKGFEQGSE